jgi:serine/threonine protein kinase
MEKTVPDFCVRSDPLAVKYSARQDPQRPTGHCGNTAMGCYDLLQTLGKGNFATVKQAVHVFSGEQVAVKIIDKTKLDSTGKTHLLQEVRCMKLLQHPNIVRLYEIIDTPSTLYVWPWKVLVGRLIDGLLLRLID